MGLRNLLDDYVLTARRAKRRSHRRYHARRDLRSIERLAWMDGFDLPPIPTR